MAARKRKSPRGKKRRQQPGLVVSGAAALGGLGLQGASALGGLGLQGASALGGVIGRNPSVAGGTIAFFVIFSFVAANALWYQPGLHPHPIFRTRDPQSPNVLGARRPADEQPAEVTTFRIERPEDAATTSATPARPHRRSSRANSSWTSSSSWCAAASITAPPTASSAPVPARPSSSSRRPSAWPRPGKRRRRCWPPSKPTRRPFDRAGGKTA